MMRNVVLIIVVSQIALLTGRVFAGDRPAEGQLTKLKREYADVLALQGNVSGTIVVSPVGAALLRQTGVTRELK